MAEKQQAGKLAQEFFRQTRRQGRPLRECTQTYMTEADDAGNAVWRKNNKPKEGFAGGKNIPDQQAAAPATVSGKGIQPL